MGNAVSQNLLGKWSSRRPAVYWTANLDEIKNDAALRAYLWCVLATHGVVWLFFVDTRILRVVTTSIEPICWPYFEDCWRFRLNSAAVGLATTAYVAVTLAGAAMLRAAQYGGAWAFAVTANGLLFALISLDYRLRANEFYMLFWLNFVYLFWPNKRWALPLVIVSFYFWAGLLKVNYEWLSGAGLYAPLWGIPSDLTWLACLYVVFLETVMIWGLLSSRAWLRGLTLAQLAIFHVQSLSQIHWFYPLLMATILAWFVIELKTVPRRPEANLVDGASGRAPLASYALVVVFAALQMVPLAYRGDHVLTGQGRVFALHMFQARQDCEVVARIEYENGSLHTRNLRLAQLPPRSVCDPVVYFNRAQNICRERQQEGIKDLDLLMRVKRRTDPTFVTVVDEIRFCAKNHQYRLFENNLWIR